MAYPALPSRAIPYHEDGTVVKYLTATEGVTDTLSDANMAEINDQDYTVVASTADTKQTLYAVFFFPEERTITGIFALHQTNHATYNFRAPSDIQGSNDTTNGYDGTWESCGGSINVAEEYFDSWRNSIGAITFTEAFETYRIVCASVSPYDITGLEIAHFYGVKEAGQTPDDIIFLDADNADAEFTTPLNAGGVPAGSSEEYNIKVKNDAAALTANSIDLTVVDALDYVRLSDDGGSTWLTTIAVGNLAHGVSSSAIKVKVEPSAAPTPLEPVRAPILCEVGSWT